MFYRSRTNLKNNVKLKLDLTKNRCKIFSKVLGTVKSFDNINYIIAEINCRLKVVFKDVSGKFFYRQLKRNLGKGKYQSTLVFLMFIHHIILLL